jgi:uncharacterized membrane-anchored protein
MRHVSTLWPRQLALVLAAASLFSLTAMASEPEAQPQEKQPKYRWQGGPGKMSLSGDVAQLQLQEDEAFLDAVQTVQLLKEMGNPTSGNEAGIIRPASGDEKWWALFEYDKAGYVKDDEKDKIDADELLKSIKDGTEEGNEFRKEHGAPGLHVERWSEPPHYDAQTHNLVWGVLAKDDNGEEVVNYQVRMLGREGFMSITLIDDPKLIDTSKIAFNKVLERFTYQPGKTYAEWRPGDKVAEYGLTALVAAGAGAAAVKLGLLGYIGKFFKVIAVGIAGAAAAVGRFFKRLFKREDQSSRNGP